MDQKTRKFKTFSLTETIIRQLLKLDGTAICAALVIARFTERTGIYSTAGAAAVSRYVGIGRPKARNAIDRLVENRVLRRVIHSTNVPDGPKNGPGAYTYVLDTGNSTPIWFSASLVDGAGKFSTPLSSLLRLGTESVRALLYMHLHEDMSTWGGVAPYPVVYKKYQPSEVRDIEGKRNMVSQFVVDGGMIAFSDFRKEILTPSNRKSDEKWSVFWAAFKRLKDAGFVYEVITVVSGGNVWDEDAMAVYHLHTYNRHGHPPKGEESLSGLVANALKAVGKCVPNINGKFYGTFGYIVPSYMIENTSVIGIYRLRFRTVQPKCSESRDSWAAVQRRQALAKHWIKSFAGGSDT